MRPVCGILPVRCGKQVAADETDDRGKRSENGVVVKVRNADFKASEALIFIDDKEATQTDMEKIDPDKIREVIGKGGSVIQKIGRRPIRRTWQKRRHPYQNEAIIFPSPNEAAGLPDRQLLFYPRETLLHPLRNDFYIRTIFQRAAIRKPAPSECPPETRSRHGKTSKRPVDTILYKIYIAKIL